MKAKASGALAHGSLYLTLMNIFGTFKNDDSVLVVALSCVESFLHLLEIAFSFTTLGIGTLTTHGGVCLVFVHRETHFLLWRAVDY